MGVIGDTPQRGSQGGLHEGGQHEQSLQVVAHRALEAAVVLHGTAQQQAGLVEQHGAWRTRGRTKGEPGVDMCGR